MKKIVTIALILLISCTALFWITIETNPEIAARLGYASGPGKPIECHGIPTLKQIEEQGAEWANDQLTGHSREQLQKIWGEADGVLSGFWGDIYHVPDSYMSVIVYYDADGVIELIKTDYRNE